MVPMTQTPSTRPGTTVLLGGTGRTGRRVAERLARRDVPVRVASRSGTPAFDWHDRGTWAAQLAGADAAYLAFSPDIAIPGADRIVGSMAELPDAARGVPVSLRA